jgi:hypothetical protein
MSERRPWFFTFRLLLSVGLFLATAEVLARVVLPDGWYVWPPHYRTDFTPDPGILHGISGPALFRTNADGMHGDPMPSQARYRVLSVGASTPVEGGSVGERDGIETALFLTHCCIVMMSVVIIRTEDAYNDV